MKAKFEVGLVLSATDKMSRVLDSAVRKAKYRFRGIDEVNKKVSTSLNRVMLTGAVIGAGIYRTIRVAEDAATANHVLENTFKQMWGDNGASSVAAKNAEKFADSLQFTIGKGKEDIMLTQAKLATFKGLSNSLSRTSGLYDRATKAAYDLAATGYGDAVNNATQLGKALSDPLHMVQALKRTGTVTFEDVVNIKNIAKTQGLFKAQLALMKAIERQVGGNAASAANASDKMKVGFQEIAETLGNIFLPTFNQAGDKVKSYVSKIQHFIIAHQRAIKFVVKAGIAMLALSVPLKIITMLISAIIGVSRIITFFKGLSAAISLASKAQALFNITMWANPIGLIIAGVVALTVVIAVCWKHFAGFRAVIKTVWDTIKGFAKIIKDYVVNRIIDMLTAIGAVGRAIKDLFTGHFSDAWKNAKIAASHLMGVDTKINAVKSVTNVVKNIPGKYQEIYVKEGGKHPARMERAAVTSVRQNALKNSNTVNYSPVININGSATESDKKDFGAMLREHGKDISRIVRDNAANNQRLSFAQPI
jgi:hypothetical protein